MKTMKHSWKTNFTPVQLAILFDDDDDQDEREGQRQAVYMYVRMFLYVQRRQKENQNVTLIGFVDRNPYNNQIKWILLPNNNYLFFLCGVSSTVSIVCSITTVSFLISFALPSHTQQQITLFLFSSRKTHG